MTVYLVGAGPGEPGLITARGLERLRSCEVVVYDRLVSPALVDEAPREAVRIAHEPHTQEEINDLLVRYGRAGSVVVRLKGGDPFVFGRGGEEMLALARAGVPFEVVPGVSALSAVPAAALIPVTHRSLASQVTLVSGHCAGEGTPPDYATLAVTSRPSSRPARIVPGLPHVSSQRSSRSFAAISSDSRSRFACEGASLCSTSRIPVSPNQRLRSSWSRKPGCASSDRSRKGT